MPTIFCAVLHQDIVQVFNVANRNSNIEIVELVDAQGYTIDGAKKALDNKRKKKNVNQGVIDKLIEIKSFMLYLRESLDKEIETDEEDEDEDE